jgi:D-amino peptidase
LKYFIITDVEGVAGVDSFRKTRGTEPEYIEPPKKQLALEVNACIEGIRLADPQAEVAVWDGHGSGAIYAGDLRGGTYLREGRPYWSLAGWDALLFVGQHAMAGMFHAPLNHTYSSLNVEYYKLNGCFIGEFGLRAYAAGLQGVPTIFLAGDDKAGLEARWFIPEIVTATIKWGKGTEAALHLSSEGACEAIRQAAERAVRKMETIPPFTGFSGPYTLEIRYVHPQGQAKKELLGGEPRTEVDTEWVDVRTVRLRTDDLRRLSQLV